MPIMIIFFVLCQLQTLCYSMENLDISNELSVLTHELLKLSEDTKSMRKEVVPLREDNRISRSKIAEIENRLA